MRNIILGSVLLATSGTALSAKPQMRVINGFEQNHPSFVELLIQGDQGEFICGGTRISEDTVLTAAHCIDEEGIQSIKMTGSSGIPFYANGIEVHPRWDVNKVSFDFGKITFDPTQYSDLPTISKVANGQQTRDEETSGNKATVVGAGLTSAGGLPAGSVQTGYVSLISNPVCADSWGTTLRDNMICANPYQGNGVDTCNGDSGGPLFSNWGDGDYLVGVISFGSADCKSLPGVYSRASFVLEWLNIETDGIKLIKDTAPELGTNDPQDKGGNGSFGIFLIALTTLKKKFLNKRGN